VKQKESRREDAAPAPFLPLQTSRQAPFLENSARCGPRSLRMRYNGTVTLKRQGKGGAFPGPRTARVGLTWGEFHSDRSGHDRSARNRGRAAACPEVLIEVKDMSDTRKKTPWKDVPEEQWNDWRWQIANRITTREALEKILPLAPEEAQVLDKSLNRLRMAITPYYASLIDPGNPDDPIRRQAVPTIAETDVKAYDLLDQQAEVHHSPVPGLTQLYPDRGIILVTDQCSMYCRHCTRRRMAGETDRPFSRTQMEACFDYIRKTPTFRDLLFTGGDPFTVDDDTIEWLLSEAASIPHLEIVRFGTRTPVVMPQRITDNLCRILEKYPPVWLNTHFNHPNEITPESKAACDRLARAGVPMGNQSVLLKGVNDCPYIFRELNQKLLTIRVRPYYIYQCDLSPGIEHFRTAVAKGIQIMEYLRGHTSGLAVPYFIIDSPGGGGKIPILPNYLVSMSDRKVILRNYEGTFTTYTEPEDKISHCPEHCAGFCERQRALSREGMIPLFEGERVALQPETTARKRRTEGTGNS